MADLNKLKLGKHPLSIGALPASYLISLSYEEQLIFYPVYRIKSNNYSQLQAFALRHRGEQRGLR